MPKASTKSVKAGAATPVPTVLLNQKAEVKEVKLAVNAAGEISGAVIKTLLKKRDEPDLIGSYPTKKLTLHLFGYQKGKAGTENKHELPPPHDSILCFGDILVIASETEADWTRPVPFKVADYEQFYTRAFGGFDDVDEDEEEEDSEAVSEVAEEDVASEAGEEELGGEEEEEDDGEEEGGGSDDEAAGAGEDEEEAPVVPKRRAAAGAKGAKPAGPKAKKGVSKAAAAAAAAGNLAAYSHCLYVPEDQALREEGEETALGTEVPQRCKMTAALRDLFKGVCTEEEVQRLERCIYNATIRRANDRHVGRTWSHKPFGELYRMIAKTIAANFHPSSYVQNTELFERWRAGQTTFEDICNMDSYQMFEARWRDNFVAQQAQEKRQLEGNRAMATDRFTCTRCWKKECTYYEMQTRSADEPMTIFITCLNCGKHWRQ
jgi:DNA-directed RNA polymerase subunit M/transcription elongation factor TFIIS